MVLPVFLYGDFMEDRFLCIFCDRRHFNTEAYFREKYLGVCRECNERLPRISKDGIFPGTHSTDALFSVFSYKGLLKRSLIRYKFQGQRRYSKVYVELMYEFLKDLKLNEDFNLMTSVPLSRKRFYERGFNQTELLAQPLAAKLGIPFSPNCVFKTRNTKKQSTVRSFSQKRENVRDAYLADRPKIDGKNILLVDDIFTTGSTIESCSKELLDKGAEHITIITLAKTSY